MLNRRGFFARLAAAGATILGLKAVAPVAALPNGISRPEPSNTVPLTLNLSYEDFLTKYIESAIESIHQRGDEWQYAANAEYLRSADPARLVMVSYFVS